MSLTNALFLVAALTSANPPSADTLAGLSFHRVPGDGYGCSVLAAGDDASWHGCCVSTPTVFYDGDLYRMWFVGGTTTSDAACLTVFGRRSAW